MAKDSAGSKPAPKAPKQADSPVAKSSAPAPKAAPRQADAPTAKVYPPAPPKPAPTPKPAPKTSTTPSKSSAASKPSKPSSKPAPPKVTFVRDEPVSDGGSGQAAPQPTPPSATPPSQQVFSTPSSYDSYEEAPAPPPAPILPVFVPAAPNPKNFKVAPSDIIQFDDEAVEIALIQDLLFEDIGAVELANISRTDLIDGQETIYSPIKNLPTIRREFNPNNVIATANNNDFFTRFGIDLLARGAKEPYMENGNLVIEIDSVGPDEEIQVQFLTDGTIGLIEET